MYSFSEVPDHNLSRIISLCRPEILREMFCVLEIHKEILVTVITYQLNHMTT